MTFRITKTWQVHIGFSWLLLVVILVASIDICAESIHHDLRIQLRPQAAGINDTDYVQRPPDTDSAVLSSRSSLNVRAHGADLEIPGDSADKRMRRHRIKRLPPDGKVQLRHAGNIASQRVKGTFDMPESVLDPDGASDWVPEFRDYPGAGFKMQVEAPSGWEIISQGKRRHRNGQFAFDTSHPQDDIYLLGGPCHQFSRIQSGVEIEVYLFCDEADPDPGNSYGALALNKTAAGDILKKHFPLRVFPIERQRQCCI